jgi:hypothetical protein
MGLSGRSVPTSWRGSLKRSGRKRSPASPLFLSIIGVFLDTISGNDLGEINSLAKTLLFSNDAIGVHVLHNIQTGQIVIAMPAPGLLFVNSKITSPKYDVESFTRWYEDIHIRDIFKTSGIKSAFRYKSPTPGTVDKPFLALYPLKDLDFLQSAEFKAIPVTDSSIPSESHTIFDLAEFDTRYYVLLKRYPGESPNGLLGMDLSMDKRI